MSGWSTTTVTEKHFSRTRHWQGTTHFFEFSDLSFRKYDDINESDLKARYDPDVDLTVRNYRKFDPLLSSLLDIDPDVEMVLLQEIKSRDPDSLADPTRLSYARFLDLITICLLLI